MANEGNDMESKQAAKETLTTDLTRRLALTFLRAGCAVTGEPLGAKELETMDPVDRQGIEAGIEAVIAELAGMGVEAFPSDGDVTEYIVEEVARYPFSPMRFDIAAKAAGVLTKATLTPIFAAKDAELARRDRKIAELEEHAAYVTGWRQEAEARAHAAKQETDKSVKSANEWRLVAELADEIKNAAIKEAEALHAKLSELAKATPGDLIPSPDEITRTFLIRTYGTMDDRNLNAWREDATRLRDAILAKVAPAFNAQHQEQPVSAFSVGRQMFSILLEDEKKDTTNLRKQIAEYRAREKSMNHALDEAGIERDQTTMQGTLQFWTLPERVGLLIVRDRETRVNLERVTAEREALKQQAGEAWLKGIDATHVAIERDAALAEVDRLKGELEVARHLLTHETAARRQAKNSLEYVRDECQRLRKDCHDYADETTVLAKARATMEAERDAAMGDVTRLEGELATALRAATLEYQARKFVDDDRDDLAKAKILACQDLTAEKEAHTVTRAKLAEATKGVPVVAAQRWEYKMTEEFIRGLPEDRRVDLNAEGARGWELSAVVRHSEYRKDFYLRRLVST